MAINFRFAGQADSAALLPLMKDFYAFERLQFDADRTSALLLQLIENQQFGRLILFDESGSLVGYMVLGFGFSLEFHGRDCFIDEFYVVPAYRSRGIGQAAVAFAVEVCRSEGIKAVHLEADHINVRGYEFYKRLGFKSHPRHLMTLWL